VATLGDDIKAAAEKKFKEIVEAKDRIFEARGMK
jgi:DnaJ like chaperone protein